MADTDNWHKASRIFVDGLFNKLYGCPTSANTISRVATSTAAVVTLTANKTYRVVAATTINYSLSAVTTAACTSLSPRLPAETIDGFQTDATKKYFHYVRVATSGRVTLTKMD